MTDDVPTPFKTEGSAEDFAVLYGAELTVEADGGGTSEDAFLETRADEQRVKIHIGYTLSGITDVTVSPLSDLANTTEYEAAAEQPKRGTRWVAEGEPDVEIVPESQVHNRVVTDGGTRVQDLPRLEVADDEISTGDIVVDLSSGKGLQVVGKSSMTVGKHPQTRSDATAEMFDADPDEPVFECVFLPDGEKVSPPTKTYAYPASRLLRYPVENATDHAGGVQIWLRVAFLDEIADAIVDDEAFGFQFEAELRELFGDVYSDDIAHLFEEILESKRTEVSA